VTKLIYQAQLLLATLAALLPLAPLARREQIAAMLELAARAIGAGAALTENAEDAAAKLAALRGELEAMAASGRPVGIEDMDAALARVHAASAAFRSAISERA
jgi:hypothetical protein